MFSLVNQRRSHYGASLVIEAAIESTLAAATDSLMVLAPRGWVFATANFTSHNHQWVLASIDARGAGGGEPRAKPQLNISVDAEAHRFAQAMNDVWNELGLAPEGKLAATWGRSSGELVVELKASTRASPYHYVLADELVAALLVTDELYDALSGTERAATRLQEEWEARVNAGGNALCDIERLEVSVGDATASKSSEGRWGAYVVGTYDTQQYVWHWGWAHADFPAMATQRVRTVCAPDRPARGLSALWRPHYFCDEGFAWAVAAHVAVAAGASPLIRWSRPGDSQVTIVAVDYGAKRDGVRDQ